MTELERQAAPSEEQVFSILASRLPNLQNVRRVPQGMSTYVYQAETDTSVCFARFLPEDTTFGVEVLAHRMLHELGVPVPLVLQYEPREPATGHSLMIVSQLTGKSLAESFPEHGWETILSEAAAALVKLHTLSVKGFGWIDRTSVEQFRGETSDFDQYFTEFWEDDLNALAQSSFPADRAAKLPCHLKEARQRLYVEQAVLVHGDLSLDHIFHENGHFTGFIDFGEIRGNHPFFDLGTFLQSDPTPNLVASRTLLESYEKAWGQPLDIRSVKLSALSFDLRFVGRKRGTPAQDFWLERVDKMLTLLAKKDL